MSSPGPDRGVPGGDAEPAHPSEAEGVRARYARRAPADARYSRLDPAALRAAQERERATARLLVTHGVEVAAARALDVGCGGGDQLLELLRFGFAPERLAGIELIEARHAQARRVLPAVVQLHLGDATLLDLPEASFDLVLQSTVFSSLLEATSRRRLADAMWRWLAPGGAVLWYDFTWDNPRNADVRGVPPAEVRGLFPTARHIEALRLTLAPPLARAAMRLHPGLYTALALLPPLRTHLLAWIDKPA